jgi:hypothetical protein
VTLTVVNPPSVYISGPYQLSCGQTGWWYATVSGGLAPYHYQWYYYPVCGGAALSGGPGPLKPPCGDWYTGGADSPTFQRSDCADFKVKCVITDALNNTATSNVIYVIVTYGLAKGVASSPTNQLADETPTLYESSQSYPNPFNPSTVIAYQLPTGGHVTLKVYNVLGQEVATLVDGIQDAGFKSAMFDASRLPSGVYFYRLETASYILNKRMLLLK